LNPRDEQITAIRERSERLRPDRLQECYDQIVSAYDKASVVEHLAQVVEERDRTPSDFRVLTSSEARHLREFNDDSYHWDFYCTELGRSIALAEKRYIFENLQTIPAQGQSIDADSPRFGPVLAAIYQMIGLGLRPDVICAPIGLFVPFNTDKGLTINWHASPREALVVAPDISLKMFWSSQSIPLDRFVVLDSRHAVWRVKLDPNTGHRLTVAIGETAPPSPPNGVVFLAETVVKYEIQNRAAFYPVPVEGEPRDDYHLRERE